VQYNLLFRSVVRRHLDQPRFLGCVRDACNFSRLVMCPAKFTFMDNFSILRLPWKHNGDPSPPNVPFFGHLSRSLPAMASIERTAYPRFKPSLTANELWTLYEG
jgi:hypothetical protein